MAIPIEAWTIGNDENGDVQSMQNIVKSKPLLGKRYFCLVYDGIERRQKLSIGKMFFNEAVERGKEYCQKNNVTFIRIEKDENY